MSTRSPTSRLIWAIGMAVFITVLALWPRKADDADILARIACNADAVALHQHLHAQGTQDPAFMAQFDTIQDYMAGLRRRDDPHLVHVRPAIASAEAARDAALAENPQSYLLASKSAVQTCHDMLFGETA
ncbi:hypothetical protein [Cognatishimia sp. F0-27]|uniref:hypothetical protein n=1 Tax=Cognatishimia sp. F0-27 TaxID=2816855 RepID=UPI001D0C2649|nr:hypothetical protein [Cognatishimia sp. F0-27]MCC1491539.1 hypothetical protein [Cognatishimia sp. F0-27]